MNHTFEKGSIIGVYNKLGFNAVRRVTMYYAEADSKYHELIIVGASCSVEIWLGDDEGHFVQRGIGILNTSLLPGHYRVEFGLGSPQYSIELAGPSRYRQEELEARTSSPRVVPKLFPES